MTLLDLLAARYCYPEWQFLTEVRVDRRNTRYADALAMNLWDCRGYAIHGFEAKVSRSDWLRELKQPEKARALWALSDQMFVVAEKDVVQAHELPPGWGLMVRHGDGLRISVKPAIRVGPSAFDRSLVACLLQAMTRPTKDVLDRERQEGVAAGRAAALRMGEDTRNQLRELQQKVNDFERATGLSLTYQPMEGVVAGLRALREADPLGVVRTLRAREERLGQAADAIEAALAPQAGEASA